MIRWGIAGCGWVARDYVAPAIRDSANGRLAALYDLSPAALLETAKLFGEAMPYADLPAFLAAIDAVYIAAPNNAHRPLVESAARAGVPVLCEKPMATNLADAQAMVAACERAGVLYATAFDQRFHPAHRRLGALVAAGGVGTVTALRIVYCCWVGADFAGDNWRIDPARAGGGALMDLAPHGLDLASYLLGDRLVDIAAMGQRQVHDYPVEDGALLIARGASGALVQLHVAYNCPETLPRRRLEIIGTSGQITAIDTMGQTPGGMLHFIDAITGLAREIDVPGAARSPFLNQVETFADCVLRGRPFAFSPQHDLAIMDLVMRAQHQAHPELPHAA
jgi:predicted dehydrogenase